MKDGELSLLVHQRAAPVLTTTELTAMPFVETWSKEKLSGSIEMI